VFDGRAEVARHERCTNRGEPTLVLDHYLEVLARKPGALPGATTLVQARKTGVVTAEHETFWAATRTKHGDAGGTRELIEVLLLHRNLPHDAVLTGLRAATTVGATAADVVAVEARKAASQLHNERAADNDAAGAAGASRVVSLTERRLSDPGAVIAGLPPDTRPLPTVTAYDDLLSRRQTPAAGQTKTWGGVMTQPRLRSRAMTEQAAQAAVDQACRALRLPTIRTRVGDIAAAAQREQLSYWGFLAELLLAECDDRDRRRSARRIKGAGFPREKWLSDFDANPAINAATIHTLARCEWVKKGEPLCLIGDSGTGKTHLLIALGTAAAQQGFRVKYALATKLVNELVEATDERQLARTIARYGRVDLTLY